MGPDTPEDLADWSKRIETSIGRELGKNENDFLESLSETLEFLEWRDTLYPKDIAQFEPRIWEKEKNENRIFDSTLWVTKPETEYELWQYVALIIEDYDFPIPEFLRSFTNTDPIRTAIATRKRNKEIRIWTNRLGNLSQQAIIGASDLLDIRLRLSGRVFQWESRTSPNSEYIDFPAKKMSNWLSKPYGFLDRFDKSSLPLCSLFQEYYAATNRARIDLEKAEDRAFVNKLLSRTDTAKRLVSSAGEPLAIAEDELGWVGISNGPNHDGFYRLRIGMIDGKPAPFLNAYLPGPCPLYLKGETLLKGPPLLRAEDSPNDTFPIPKESMESAEGLLFLKNQNLPLPPHLKNSVISIPMTPNYYLQVNEDDSKAKKRLIFKARIFATSRDQRYWFALSEDGWSSCANPDNGSESAMAEEGTLFELPSIDEHIRRIEELECETDEDRPDEWTRLIDFGFPKEFTSWIQGLPASIIIHPDEEIDTLIDARPHGRYALRLEQSDNPDWFEIELTPQIDDESLSNEEVEQLIQAAGDFVRVPGKGWRRFDPSLNSGETSVLASLGLSTKEAVGEVHRLHSLQLAQSDLESAVFEKNRKAIIKRAKEISSTTPANLPKGISSELRPYQEDGFRFLAYLSQNGFGGILADDMGLGKTLQSLAWLTWLKHRTPKEERFQCLVICPKSVVHVWKNEVSQHSSFLDIRIFDPLTINASTWEASNADILVANYSQMRINHRFFTGIDWTVSLLDEGQNIKNPQSQTAKVARSLKSTHRLVLTGTPIENKALDLWSLFAFAMPGLLGTQTSFKRQYKDSDSTAPARLSQRTKHFMLRRRKAQVAPDLPPRMEETVACQLEEEQRALYEAELGQAQKRILNLKSDSEFDKERFNILASLLRLRQICCHPRLIDPTLADAKSAKLEALLEHVAELREEGHKVLVFSQFVQMLEIIGEELEKIDCPYLTLTGQTQNREDLVNRFQEDSDVTVFLLSLKAAGSGLNLTAASYVILYDPWWNPAVEAQAIDRTHRIGQKNSVNAYRFIASNSVEEKIQNLQLKKEALANEVVQEESLANVLDIESLKYVLSE